MQNRLAHDDTTRDTERTALASNAGPVTTAWAATMTALGHFGRRRWQGLNRFYAKKSERMIDTLTVYGVTASPYVRAAAVGLEEKGADYNVVALGPAGSKSPAHLARHPFGRVPALTHGDFTLHETQAILRYVDRAVPGPALTPSAPRAEARMNQLCGITDWYVMPHVTMGVTFERLVAPRLGRPTDEAKIAGSLEPAKLCIAEIARLLGSAPFMTGDTVSLADVLLAPHFAFFAFAPESQAILEPHKALTAWIERMNARKSLSSTTAEKLTARATRDAA